MKSYKNVSQSKSLNTLVKRTLFRFESEGDWREALYSCEPPIRNTLLSGLRVDRADSRDEWVDEEGAPFLPLALS